VCVCAACAACVMDDASKDDAPAASFEAEEGVFAAVVAIFVSIFVTALAATFQCSALYMCAKSGTCTPLSENMCSFSNIVSPVGFSIYNSSNDGALDGFTRGVCAPGERQTASTAGGKLQCSRSPAFPDGFVSEIADSGAATEHERGCGRWIAAGGPVDAVHYFSFYDAPRVADDVAASIKLDTEQVQSSSDISRFVLACRAMIVNSAVPQSAALALSYLKRELHSGDISSSTGQAGVLRRLGRLVVHYCDTPLTLGLAFGGVKNDRFVVKAGDGALLTADEASEILYSFGENSQTREEVRKFASEMQTAPFSMLRVPSNAQLGEVLGGALEGSSLEDSLGVNAPLQISVDGTLSMLSKFIYAVEETSPRHANAYLLAAACQCALSVRSVVTGEFGTNAAVENVAALIRKRRRGAIAIGRFRSPDDDGAVDRFSSVNESVAFEASTISWSMLTRRTSSVLYATNPEQSSSTCWDAANVAFADSLDRQVYNKMVSERFVTRMLPAMTNVLKGAVAAEIRGGRLSKIISSAGDRAKLAASAQNLRFRIAGARRTSSFGRNIEFERPVLESTDGALVIMLKQAKAVFLDRLRLVLDGSDLCQHPPIFPSSSRNAYFLTASPCVVLLPGILVQPFVSDRFDEQSLYGRIGFVIAHEIAHVASNQLLWDIPAATLILSAYSRSTWSEAVADLTAASAIVATGMVSSDQACAHVSQLWCARVPKGYFLMPSRSHPPANSRGDNICRFLKQSF